ncbi:MAG: ABC transporter ATP-binding protein [Catenulispora sp. 13_1_20CM_3_70_7]|nr:MAG: ABC transporter ATP-binding protein [Catenulispora sp. 13_1_20CM_3_70_7]
MPSPPKIRVEGLGKTFQVRDGEGFTALDDISIDVAAGEFLVVVGPSGCGKSTLLDLISGLSKPSGGRVLVDGVPVTGPALDRAVVFQQYALLPWRTAQRNVEFALEARSRLDRPGRKARAERAREHLALVGLTGFEDRYPHELSGGMRQRVAIARALAADPKVLLMDEPFAALDAQTRDGLQEELRRIWQATGTTIVFITDSIDEAVYLGQRVAIMTSRPGRIKQVVEVRLGERDRDEDVRSSSEFAAYRHEVWSLLRDEVTVTREVVSVG